MHEMLTRLLAVGDDVDAGILLLLQDEQRRVALGLDQRLALLRPGRPQRLGLGQPERLGQAPGDRGLEHSNASFSPEFSAPIIGRGGGRRNISLHRVRRRR